jgi:hypothetical protein
MLSVSPSFFLAAFCWLAADHGDAQGDGFRNRSWAYQSSARKGATDHRARKAMISESPVNTFIEIGVRPPPLYFRQSFAANPTVEIRVGRFRGTK